MRWLLVLTAVAVAMPGCRNNAQLDAHLELMNAERRALEDELYELEYDYEAAVQKLEETRRENERLREKRNESSDDFFDLSPEGQDDSRDEVPDLELSPPMVEPGVPTTPTAESDVPQGNGLRNAFTRPPFALGQRFDSASRTVTHIYIDPVLTRGRDFDGRPGLDGITLVIEPRDDSGVFVPQGGAVSVVLLDYANRGSDQAARVARWDLDINQIRPVIFDSEDRKGIHLPLRWPGQPPTHSRLRMDVRFTTEDGRQLETRQDIRLTAEPSSLAKSDGPRPEGEVSQARQAARGWTPRSVKRVKAGGGVAGQPNAAPLPGPPWSLEQAAGDAIRRDMNPTDERAPQRTARPEWKPYR